MTAGTVRALLLTAALSASLASGRAAAAEESPADRELWSVVPDFASRRPQVVAVLPMDNVSLEAGVDAALQSEAYDRIAARGYQRVSAERVREAMASLGIQTPGQLAGIAPERLGRELGCDAVLRGQIEQSAAVHAGVYDAVVVSVSLSLVECATGRTLWQASQWRVAHRQWSLDPVNLAVNAVAHERASRAGRVAYLVDEMFKTLPPGPVVVEAGNLLDQATEVPVVEDDD